MTADGLCAAVCDDLDTLGWNSEDRGCVAGVQSGACCGPHSPRAEIPWPTATFSEMEPLAGLCTGETTAWVTGRLPDSRTTRPHTGLNRACYEKVASINRFSLLEI